MTDCKFCGQPICWDTATGKPIPFNLDGSRHVCRSNPLMEPHEHRRENGSLICVGYQPWTRWERFIRLLRRMNPV